MQAFNYHRPNSLDEASGLPGGMDDALFLAGGQSLLPVLRQGLAAPSDLIDLGAISELRGIEVGGDAVTIGATTKHAEVAASDDLKGSIPGLAEMANHIGDNQVRNRGTLGGSLANNDPAADYPAAVLGLGATIVTSQREIAADDFFQDMFETALEPGEIIRAVRFPVPEQAAYVKFHQPASRFALVGVFVCRSGGEVRVAVTGAGYCVFRSSELESALSNDFSPDAISQVKVPSDDLNADMHGSAEYRAHLITVMAQRAVKAATG
jgi:carbon-monoxide dehydrogenase medium subunit